MTEYLQAIYSGTRKRNDKSQIVAYYPYKEGNTPASFTVETDQTSGYGASDFMAAKKSDVLPTTNVISMNFKHMFTKLVINVTKEVEANISSIAMKVPSRLQLLI